MEVKCSWTVPLSGRSVEKTIVGLLVLEAFEGATFQASFTWALLSPLTHPLAGLWVWFPSDGASSPRTAAGGNSVSPLGSLVRSQRTNSMFIWLKCVKTAALSLHRSANRCFCNKDQSTAASVQLSDLTHHLTCTIRGFLQLWERWWSPGHNQAWAVGSSQGQNNCAAELA